MVSTISAAPDHPNLVAIRRWGPTRERKAYCITGVTSGGTICAYNTNLTTLERAIKERVFYVCKDGEFSEPFRPNTEYFSNTLSDFKSLLKKQHLWTNPMDARSFAASYQAPRAAVYLKAAIDNETTGFHPKFARVKAFVKSEKYDFSSKIPVPRVIQPRDPRYGVENGRFIKPIEKKIYKAIDTIFGDVTVYKQLNAENRGRAYANTWKKYSTPCCIGLDAHRFDEHVSNAALRWEHSVYELCYPGNKYFKMLLRLQRDNKCSAYVKDGCLKYTTIHNRMSGDHNTSLGNVLLMCAMAYTLFKQVGVKASLINDGDDCNFICEKRDEPRLRAAIEKFYTPLGFTVVVEPTVYQLEHAEFCQCHPVRDNDGNYLMVRNPRKALAKDAVSLKPLDNPKVFRKWLAAIGEGGLSLTLGMPIYQAYYDMYRRNSRGAKVLTDPSMRHSFFRMSRGMKRIPTPISPETRYSFWLAFGYSPEEQLALETYYDELELGEDSSCRFACLPG